ncbi:integrin alpha-X-like [Trichosurus vulpecula]|uniref:integrin alpha-X-like n=1 Tax=Trichosurus vulpecula TaxID=9337 RepID=UPI00186B3131|nr:integrin alpha-X-like [Trichosurus vulpecula]
MDSASLVLLMALASSHGFNLDTDNPTIFQSDAAAFGHTVVLYESSRLVVGAPLEKTSPNRTGQLYNCEYGTRRCEAIPIQIPQEAVNMSLGLSLTTGTNPSQILACGPTVHQACKVNTYMKGFCFVLNSNLQQRQRFPPTLQECPKQDSDIAFLIDGSGSISNSDFKKMKNFVKAVMSQFEKPNTQFSLMQFASLFWTHFTFNTFKNSRDPGKLVDDIFQLTGVTKTATGIKKVVTELFHKSNGAREYATKILIVITDGEKYEDSLEYRDVIPMAEKAGIIRYAIGVGKAFDSQYSKQELNEIASKPSKDHVFWVDNFEALSNIQNQLKEKIFAIEGTKSRDTISFQYEMSQEGFSAAFTSEGPALGAVGTSDWSGGVFLYSLTGSAIFIKTSNIDKDMNDAYLGYSTEAFTWNGAQSLVLGAPRYQHIGKVVIFVNRYGTWVQKAEVKGTQIGSYFGAALCPVDLNRDSNTDLILIGAPHYYEQNNGGRVSICSLLWQNAKWQCNTILKGQQGHPFGRFGAALAVLGDINGDKLIDVAVGAPGEEENHGAIYLFHGAAGSSINPSYTQRISGSLLSPTLQYFGQSLSGGQDITQDGLMDVAVGAQGQVLLLRTQPVLKVKASIEFKPVELARSVFECQAEEATNREAGSATICLTISKSVRDRLTTDDIQSAVSYDLVLDPGRLSPRAIFDETKNRILKRAVILGLGNHCETVELLLPECVEDSVTPIILRLNFTLEGQPIPFSGNLRPVLAMGSQNHFTGALPFEKNCGDDHICKDDLSVTFSFLGLQTLLVGHFLELEIEATVRNQGEDSYSTVVTFTYPPGLSYRRVSVAQTASHQQHLPHLVCDTAAASELENLRSSSCSINHPIFRMGAEVTFVMTFHVSPTAELGDQILIKATVSSENNTPMTSKNVFQLKLPVKYAIYTVINSIGDSTKYLNFSVSEDKQVNMTEHRYRINNLGQRALPVHIDFWVPVELNKKSVWNLTNITYPQDSSIQCAVERKEPSHSNFLTHIQKSPVLNCSIAVCLRIGCDIPTFKIQEELNFIIKGNLSFGWVSQTLQKKLLFVSSAKTTFDELKYSQFPGQEVFLSTQIETVVEQYEIHNPIPLILGSTVGGLLLLALITIGLYKLGFFKRKYKDMMEDKAEETDLKNEDSLTPSS